jgi:hypothetical protein
MFGAPGWTPLRPGTQLGTKDGDDRSRAFGWHLVLFPVNTLALMSWADLSSATPVLNFWFLTLPFALAFAAVPYLLLVVFPARMHAARDGLRISGLVSAAIALFLIMRGFSSGKSLASALGFGAQLSFLPCAFLYWARKAGSNVREKKGGMSSNRSFDTDTQQHCAARRPGDRAPRGAMPLRAGQLRR